MSRGKIVAELRRSAREDQSPWVGVDWYAGLEAMLWLNPIEDVQVDRTQTVALFFLIVAEATQ